MLIYQKGYDSAQKLDYFLCGGAGALFAYIGQHYEPHPLNYWYSYLIPIALLLLTFSMGFSLWRLHLHLKITQLNQHMMNAGEKHADINRWLRKNRESENPMNVSQDDWNDEILTSEQLKELKTKLREEVREHQTKADKKCKIATFFGYCRNIFLIAGFLVILFAKIFQPYMRN